jgi:hypothetical protein
MSTPLITLDLSKASSAAWTAALDKFEEHRQAQHGTLPPLDMPNGWYTVTPEMAESLLLRNPVGANRKPTQATTGYYARQMAKGDWKKTGQPIIFTKQGKLVDAGHRLWACYFSGASFDTYIITDVDDTDGTLFAYIDNSKPRNASDALVTAGLNGLSKLLAAVVKIAVHYENDCYTANKVKALDRMSPIEIIDYVQRRPNISKAARYMVGEHKAAASIIFYKDVATFAAYQILDLHGEEVLDEFMGELDQDDHDEDTVFYALQKVLIANKNASEKNAMSKPQVLACVIKAFNALARGEPMTAKKIPLRVNEKFPSFIAPQPEQLAAE